MASYLIKSLICSGLLLAVYHLFLGREKMLRFNRFYLLAAMVFSLLCPLATIEMPSGAVTGSVNPSPLMANMDYFISANDPVHSEATNTTSFPDYLPLLVYGLASIVLLARLLVHIVRILRSKVGRERIPFGTAQLVLVPGNRCSYTFFKSIFLSKEAFKENRISREILTHELAHATQMHSLDIVFTELLFAICWFNPFLLLYLRAIRLNHEFLADEAALAGHANVQQYQLLLLNTILADRESMLTSPFNYSITKKRLAMMTTKINLRVQFVKKAFVALLLVALAFSLAEKTYSQQAVPIIKKDGEKGFITGKAAVSEREMDDFFATVEKYSGTPERKGRIYPVVNMTPQQGNELYDVYERMSDEQKEKVRKMEIGIIKMDKPVRKNPEPEMFENWKKPQIFGIWLNGRHVPNSELDKYRHTDIAEYTLHKLVGKGLKGKGYKYQLELTTNDEFDRTFEERMQDRVVLVRSFHFAPPRDKVSSKK